MFTARRKIITTLFVLALGLLLAPTTQAQGFTVTMTHNSVLGDILTDAQGRTLYRFTKDMPNANSA